MKKYSNTRTFIEASFATFYCVWQRIYIRYLDPQ